MLTINRRLIVMEEKNKEKSTITSVAEIDLDLLSRHLQVMTTVKEHGPIGIIKLSQMTGQPQHMIRYSLRTLEKDGIIEPSPQGAIVTDKIHEALGTIETTLEDFTTKVQDLKKKIK
jgi:predicted transcriptional regulator